ncbi:MAG: DNA cytosine methyltransferase [Pseudomonadota bacterium]
MLRGTLDFPVPTHFLDGLDAVPQYHKHLRGGGKPKRGSLIDARRLTVYESALLKTLPENMVFEGSRSSHYTQVGNAVPPLLAEVAGKSVARALHEVGALEATD